MPGHLHRVCAMLAVLIGVVLLSEPARAFDCAQAKSPLEKALCADPAAKADDDAMVKAFQTLRAAQPTDQAQALLGNQRTWLRERNAGCAAEAAPAACLSQSNRRRIAVLSARAEAGPGVPGRLAPVFVFRPGSKTDYAVDVVLFRFVSPETEGQRAVNAAVDKMLAEVPVKKDEPEDTEWSYDRTARIAYASASLLSIPVEGWTFTGGAHGETETQVFNVDPASGRVWLLADLLDASGLKSTRDLCRMQIIAQKKEKEINMNEPEARKQTEDGLSSGLADLSTWTFGADKATVNFDAYTLGSFAEGAYTCDLPYPTLKRVAKPSFPLPR